MTETKSEQRPGQQRPIVLLVRLQLHPRLQVDDGLHGCTVFTLIADALAVTLNMADCAVCLFEAASRAPCGARPDGSYVPELFEPTIAAWSTELFGA